MSDAEWGPLQVRDTEDLIARKLIADDCAWIAEAVSALRERGNGHVAFVLLPQIMRIVYEGYRYLRQAAPAFPELLSGPNYAVMQQARLSTKLLEVRDGYNALADFFEESATEHHKRFIGMVLRPLRRWARDLGLYYTDGHLVATTQTMVFWSGLGPEAINDDSAIRNLRRVAEDAGGVVAWLMGFCGQVPPPDLPRLPDALLEMRDVVNSEYLSERFENHLPAPVKGVLVAIEAAINSAIYLYPTVVPHRGDAVFRMQVITVAHVIDSLREVRDRHVAHPTTPAEMRLTSLLDAASGGPLNTREFRFLRNTCMHYGLRVRTGDLDLNHPMRGLVEVTMPGLAYDDVRAAVERKLRDASDLLAAWQP